MTLVAFNRVALPAFAAAALVLAGLLPAWRLRRGTGASGIALHRPAHRLQRWTAGWLVAALLGLGVWIGLYAALGPDRIGVWHAGPIVTWAGWTAAVLGLALVVVGQVSLGPSWRVGIDDRPTELVTGGIYRVTRNPIFAGMIVVVTGLAAVAPGPWPAASWAVLVAMLGVQVRAEEQHLLAQHGPRYRAYAASVGRFLPGAGRLR